MDRRESGQLIAEGMSEPGSYRRRRHHRRQHIFDAWTGDAGDQSGTTL